MLLILLPLRTGAEAPTFPARAERVMLTATAVDGHGRPVRDLRPEELKVYEDGRLQTLSHFAAGEALAAKVLLLVDVSGSMDGRLKTTSARMAAYQLLAALGPADEAALAVFDGEYRPRVAFTTDKARVRAAFDGLAPFGSTALHDALERAASELAQLGEGRRAVVVITDGIDTASRLSPDAVLQRSRALDVPIYALTVISPLDDPRSPYYAGQARATEGAALLARYAALSGGAAFSVSEFGALKRAAEQIVGELKHQYRLAYEPQPAPPQTGGKRALFRRIEVRATRKGVTVRTRSGYVPPS